MEALWLVLEGSWRRGAANKATASGEFRNVRKREVRGRSCRAEATETLVAVNTPSPLSRRKGHGGPKTGAAGRGGGFAQ